MVAADPTAAAPCPIALALARAPQVIIGGGHPLELAPLDGALLAWLALEGPTPRARLASLLWPEKAAEAARNSLRQRLFQLRRQLGVELVVGGATVSLASGVSHDLGSADTVLGQTHGDDLARGEFAAWLEGHRARRRQRVRQALAELADRAEAARDWDDALAHARELVALEPLSEDAHRRMMRLHYLAGDRPAALQAFDRCEQCLKDELGTRPSPDTLALLATIEASGTAGALPVAAAVPGSVLRPPRLVGRERELAQLDQGWQAGHLVAVVGEAGVGKSRLLQEFAALRSGVVCCAGRPGDAGVPFATLARLLRAVLSSPAIGPQAPADATPRHELARVLPELDGALPRAAGEGQRLVLQRALAQTLADRPGLHGLIVDDLHYADEASVEMLAALVDSGGDPLHWVLAFRPVEAGSPLRTLQDRLVEQVRLQPLALAPLDLEQLAALVDSLALPGVHGAALAPALLKRTGGNPLFVLETLKQAWVERTLADLAGPADAARLPRPMAVGRLIEQRLARLSPGALALARVAAVAGVDFDIGLAEHVLGTPALQFADALNELAAAQVLRDQAFAHDLVFEAVHASVPPAIARHLHARIADWLERHGGAPARVARHWIDAGRDVQALPWLGQAADAARRALRPKEVVAFLEAKSAIEAAAGERAAAFDSLEAATTELRDSNVDLQRGLAQCDRLDALADSARQRARALLQRGLLHTWVWNHAAAYGWLERALAELETAQIADPTLAADIHQALGDAYQRGGRSHDALTHLRTALAWFDTQPDLHARGLAHGDLACTLDNLGRLDEALIHHRIALDQMRASGDLANLAAGSGNFAINRLDAGDLEAADAALVQAQQIIRGFDGFEAGLPRTQALRALALTHLGRYRDALEQAEQGLACSRTFLPAFVPRMQLRLALCWAHLGQWARMLPILDEVEPDADDWFVPILKARLAWAWAGAHPGASGSRDAGAAALAELRQWRERLLAEGDRPDLSLMLRIDLASADAPEVALPMLLQAAADARRIGHRGSARAAHLRAAGMAAATDPDLARQQALAALALADEGVVDTITLPAELWLMAGRALLAAGDGAAARLLERGREWVLATASAQVPEPFREGFLHRHPVNRALLALATRADAR